MSTTIDNRVVEMQFNNSDFEKNVRTSLSTLNNLNTSLNDLGSVNSLKGLGKSFNDIDLSGLETSINTVNDRFSTMGIIGMTALMAITNAAIRAGSQLISSVIGPIKNGGFNRALNLENAKFQLQGILKSSEAVAEVMKDVDYGVKDTAYSLDAAAKVAAQLAASGLRAGTGMQKSLRGISGVAAMTNASYEEIGAIFTTVAGQGKMMTMQLRQLEARGMNAAANMADFMNGVNDGTYEATEGVTNSVKKLTKGLKVSEADIRDFVTKGKIDFATFAESMDTLFGDHAKAANNTFQGALSNMKAALARTGAMFAGPYLENMRHVFNAIRLSVNALNKQLGPLVDTAEKVMVKLRTLFVNSLLDPSENVREEIVNIFKSLVGAVDALNSVAGTVLGAIGNAFRSVFAPITAKHVQLFAMNIELLALKLLYFAKVAAPHIESAFKGIFNVFGVIGKGLGLVAKGLSPFLQLGAAVISFMIRFAGFAGEFVSKIISIFQQISSEGAISTENLKRLQLLGFNTDLIEKFISALQKVQSVIGPVIDYIQTKFWNLIDLLNGADFSTMSIPKLQGLEDFKNILVKVTEPLRGAVEVFKSLFNGIINIIQTSAPVISGLLAPLGQALLTFAEGFKTLVDKMKFNKTTFDLGGLAAVGAALWVFYGVIVRVYKGTAWTFGKLSQAFSSFGSRFAKLVNPLEDLTKIPANINSVLAGVQNSLATFTAGVKAKALKDIAISILILAGALFLISTIDTDKLMAGIAAMGAMFAELVIAFKQLEKIPTTTGGGKGLLGFMGLNGDIIGTAIKMIAISVAIGLLAGALKKIASIDPERLGSSMLVLTGTMALFVASMTILSAKAKTLAVTGKAIIAFALAISILASALKKISKIEPDKLGTSFLVLAGLMATMVASLIILTRFSKDLSVTSMSMIAFAFAISILAGAIKKLSKIDKNLGTALAAFATAISGMVIAFILLSKFSSKLPVTAISMIAFALAISILSGAIKKLSTIDSNLGPALLSFAVAIGAMVGAFILLSKFSSKLPITAAAMIAFSIAVSILSKSIINLSNIDQNIGMALLGLVVAVGSMVGAFILLSKFATSIPVTAVAMIAFSIAISILADAITKIGSIDSNLGRALFGLVVAVGSMVAAFILLSKFAGSLSITAIGMIAFAGAVYILAQALKVLSTIEAGALIGTGAFIVVLVAVLGKMAMVFSAAVGPMLAFAAAAALLSIAFIGLAVGIGILGTMGSAGIELIVELLVTVLEKLPEIINAVIVGLASILQSLAENAEQITFYAVEAVTGFINGIANAAPGLVQSGILLIVNLIQGLAEGLPQLIDAGMNLIISLLVGLTDAIATHGPALNEALFGFIEAAIAFAASALPNILELGMNLVFSLIEGLLAVGKEISSTLMNMIIEAIGEVLGLSPEAIEAGKMLVQGIIDGIGSFLENLLSAARELATKALDAIKGVLGINSPSEEGKSIGHDLDEGVSIGIDENADTVIASAESVGEDAAEAMNSAVDKGISDAQSKIDQARSAISSMNRQISKSERDQMRAMEGRGTHAYSNRTKAIEANTKAAAHNAKAALGLKDSWGAASNALGSIGGGGKGGGGGSAGKATDALSSLSDTIKNQISIFDEWSKKSDITADKMLSNMRSQIAGVTQWAQNMRTLGERGIDQGLLQSLAQLGPQGADKVAAFVSMTNEQLAEAGSLYQQSLALPDSAAAHVVGSFGNVGGDAAQGFINGLQGQHAAMYGASQAEGQAAIDGMADGAGTHSPSWKTELIGRGLMDGINLGIKAKQVTIINTINILGKNLIKAFENVGKQCMEGFAKGIESNASIVEKAAAAAAKKAEKAAESALEIESPSKVAERRLGRFFALGFAQGIAKFASEPVNEASTMAEAVAKAVEESMLIVDEVLGSGIDLNPVITPRLDLGGMTSDMAAVNGMFENKRLKVPGSAITGDGSSSSSNGPTFIQNNYSPKALSRLEIYRHTRNQLAMARGV